MSTLKVNSIQARTGDTITIPSGSTLTGPAGSISTPGSVVQVVEAFLTNDTSTTSTSSMVDTGLSITITPKKSTNKFYIRFDGHSTTGSGHFRYFTVDRNGTNIGRTMDDTPAGSYTGKLTYMGRDTASPSTTHHVSFSIIDTPSTASAITYKVQFAVNSGGTHYLGRRSGTQAESPATMTVMEIAQ